MGGKKRGQNSDLHLLITLFFLILLPNLILLLACSALKGMYSRLAETAVALLGPQALPAKAPHKRGLPVYTSADELHRDLLIIKRSLCSHNAAPLVVDRLEPLLRAVNVFGFQ